MKLILSLSLGILLASCKQAPEQTGQPPATESAAPLIESVVRINSTSQSWNAGQPWEKNQSSNLRSLGAIVGPGQVLTSGEMVSDSTYLEFELPDGSQNIEAKIIAVDYEANLALLTAKNEEDLETFFKGTTPLNLADSPTIGETMQIFQVEENATTLLTSGTLQSVDIGGGFVPKSSFLNYAVKASMQSAASSFSLPVIQDNELVGILLSYDAEDQISDVLAIEIISQFLKNARETPYKGFPSLGVAVSKTDDPSFRDFLKLTPEQGGIYVSSVKSGGAAEKAGIKKGDVILSADGNPIDSLGYYENEQYGSVFWGHIVRGEKSTGDELSLNILRDGQQMEITAVLIREETADNLVPDYQFDRAPNFLVKGGLIFQELTRPVLEAFGKEWTSRAPLNLLDAYENPEKYEEGNERIIFLSGSIPTPATIGYERLRNLIVKEVNGVKIDSMKTLIKAFEKPGPGNLHSIRFLDEDFTVYLDENVSNNVDTALLQRGLNRLYRAD